MRYFEERQEWATQADFRAVQYRVVDFRFQRLSEKFPLSLGETAGGGGLGRGDWKDGPLSLREKGRVRAVSSPAGISLPTIFLTMPDASRPARQIATIDVTDAHWPDAFGRGGGGDRRAQQMAVRQPGRCDRRA
jgi:hypothetical protein